MDSMGSYYVEIVRDPKKEKGPGIATLYLFGTIKEEWEVITGGSELDPRKYGGLTPPISWRMVEPISKQKHPRGRSFYFARIYPAYREEMDLYVPPRTVDLMDVPFKTHAMGRSSGCFGPNKRKWAGYMAAINDAWINNGGWLEFEVKDLGASLGASLGA